MECDCSFVHEAMAQLSVAYRNADNYLLYVLEASTRDTIRRRARQYAREGNSLLTLLPERPSTLGSSDWKEDSIPVESEVVPMR
jgi:hypothetical protein